MTQKHEKRHFGWGFFIVGILFILAAVLSFMSPGSTLETLAYLFAFVAIANGIWLLVSRGGALRIVAGVLNILVGLFFVFNIFFTMAALPTIFAVWFILNSLLNLLALPLVRAYGTGYMWFTALVNVLGVALGIMLLFNPVASILTMWVLVGFYLMLIGIECVVAAFVRMSAPASAMEEDYDLSVF